MRPNARFRMPVKEAILLLLTAACSGPGGGNPTRGQIEGANWTPPRLPEVDSELPDPGDLLRGAVDFLAGQPEVSVEAVVTYGAVQPSGQVLHFDLLQRVAVGRPDRLAWVTLDSDGTVQRGFVANGRATLLLEPANMWGVVDVPPSIDEAVDLLTTEYDLDVPFPDLLAANPSTRWAGDDVLAVEYVGEEWVQGAWTDHVALRKPWVDVEIWIRQGAEPFFSKMTVVFTEEEGRPSYTARFREWSTSHPDGAMTFGFTPPEGAQRVDLVPVVRD